MLRWAFEAAEGLEVQRVGSQWRWWGVGVEEKKLGGPGARVLVAQIPEAQCMRISWGVLVSTAVKTGVVGIET